MLLEPANPVLKTTVLMFSPAVTPWGRIRTTVRIRQLNTPPLTNASKIRTGV
jgi:hypothetical protein